MGCRAYSPTYVRLPLQQSGLGLPYLYLLSLGLVILELLSELSNNVIFKRVLTNDNYRKELYSQYRTMESNISWELVLRESLDKT